MKIAMLGATGFAGGYVLDAMPAMNACIAGPPHVDWLEVVI